MAGFLFPGLLFAEFLDEDFVALYFCFQDCEFDGCACNVGEAELGCAAFGADDEDLIDFVFGADFGFAAFEEVDEDFLTFDDLALAAGFFDYCVHFEAPSCVHAVLSGGREGSTGFDPGPQWVEMVGMSSWLRQF